MNPRIIYLDNSATTFPKPQSVRMAVSRAMSELSANPGRSGHRLSLKTSEAVYSARKNIASFFGQTEESNVIFTPSCTYAINAVLKGVLKKGDHVVISSLEHNAVMRPLEKLKNMGIIRYTAAEVVPGDDEKTIQNFRDSINERTRLIICTHASNVFGIRLPAERLCALAHQNGLQFALDAAQSAGVVSIDMEADHYDFVCCAGHKGLYGPMGIGLLLMNHPLDLNTVTEGGTGSESINLSMPSYYPDRMESGTLNIPGIVGLSAGVDHVKKLGIETIFQKEMKLIKRLYRSLRKNDRVELYTPEPDDRHYLPVLSFSVSGTDSETVASFIDSHYGIATRAGLHCAPLAHKYMETLDRGTVRISPSVFTTEYDIQMAENAVNNFCRLQLQ